MAASLVCDELRRNPDPLLPPRQCPKGWAPADRPSRRAHGDPVRAQSGPARKGGAGMGPNPTDRARAGPPRIVRPKLPSAPAGTVVGFIPSRPAAEAHSSRVALTASHLSCIGPKPRWGALPQICHRLLLPIVRLSGCSALACLCDGVGHARWRTVTCSPIHCRGERLGPPLRPGEGGCSTQRSEPCSCSSL